MAINKRTKILYVGIVLITFIILAIVGDKNDNVGGGREDVSCIAFVTCYYWNSNMKIGISYPGLWQVIVDPADNSDEYNYMELTSQENLIFQNGQTRPGQRPDISIYEKSSLYYWIPGLYALDKEDGLKKVGVTWVGGSSLVGGALGVEYISKSEGFSDAYGILVKKHDRLYKIQFNNRKGRNELTVAENEIVQHFFNGKGG